MLLLSCHPVLLLNSQLKREGRKASSGFSKDSEHDVAFGGMWCSEAVEANLMEYDSGKKKALFQNDCQA